MLGLAGLWQPLWKDRAAPGVTHRHVLVTVTHTQHEDEQLLMLQETVH